MRLIDIAAENIDVQELKQKIFAACCNKPDNKANWSKTRAGLVCCHLDNQLFLTDNDFKPLLIFESTSNISASGISREGNYMVCQMQANLLNDENSGATALIDVQQRRIIKQAVIEVGGLGVPAIVIYEQTKNIVVHIANTSLGDKYNLAVQYDFDLRPDERTLREYYQKAELSPYTLNERIRKLIANMQGGIDKEDEKEVLVLLAKIGADLQMSEYQLSLTYKELGSMYEKNGLGGKAIAAYTAALALNPKIAVKKALQRLQKEFGEDLADSTIPYPQLIEKKRALAADNYTLPSTYDADWRKKRSDYLADRADKIRKRLGLEQTNIHEFVANADELNDMSDVEFNALFNKMCQPLDDIMRKDARKIAEQLISGKSTSSGVLTVREHIILYLTSMLKVCKKD